MPSSLPFVSLFILGIFAQVFLSIDFFKNPKKKFLSVLGALGISAVFPLITLLAIQTQSDPQADKYGIIFGIWCALFCLCIMVFFRDEILPVLNEKSLLVINLITLYLAIKSSFHVMLLAIYIFISLAIIINALMPRQLKPWQEMGLLGWYFILIVTIPIAHFNFTELYNNFSGKATHFSVASPIALGMTVSFVVVHLWFLFWFLPYEGRPKEQIEKFFTSKYDEAKQFSTIKILLLVLLVAGLLVANYYLGFIPDSLLVILTLTVSSFFDRQKPQIFANQIYQRSRSKI